MVLKEITDYHDPSSGVLCLRVTISIPAPFPVPVSLSLDLFNGVDGLFQQSLQDLVKGIRLHHRDEDNYIRSRLVEIADECRSSESFKKTTAVLKLTYLQMMGYSPSFASFHIVEVLSSSDFATKRIGYLAAAQCFSPATDVLLLTTNQFKKDLCSGKVQECSQALTCLARIVTEELGHDLAVDISLLLASPRPYIRKKALLVLYRLILVHPDTLPVVSARFRERLTDSDPGVLCAAVTVTTELSRAAPSTFLSLAPIFYQLLMNKESNNWTLIKIIKLMGVLAPSEPRLGKKLVAPLTNLMRNTRAKSVLYECCSTVTIGLLDYPEPVELCAKLLTEFMNDSDQNLKYLGLLSMSRLIHAHPHLAVDLLDTILDCLDDDDIGIRTRALEIISAFTSKRNLRDISRILLRKLQKAESNTFPSGVTPLASMDLENPSESFRFNISASIDEEFPFRAAIALELLRAGEYKRASSSFKGGYTMLCTANDFAWYITDVLGELAKFPSLSAVVRSRIADQLVELTSRVEALRYVSVMISCKLLSLRTSGKWFEDFQNCSILSNGENSVNFGCGIQGNIVSTARLPNCDAVLSSKLAGSLAWIVGEYATEIEDFVMATKLLVNFPKNGLDSAAQVRILTACIKIFVSCSDADAVDVYDLIRGYMNLLHNNEFAEVQDRAWFFESMLTEFGIDRRVELTPLFSGKLIPVDPRAQGVVPVPSDLDLDSPLLKLGSVSITSYLYQQVCAEEADAIEEEDDLKSSFNEAKFLSFDVSSTNTGFPPSPKIEDAVISSKGTEGLQVGDPFYLGKSVCGNGGGRMIPHCFTPEEDRDREWPTLDEPVIVLGDNNLERSVDDDARIEKSKSRLEKQLSEAFSYEGNELTGKVISSTGKKKKRGKKKK